MSRGGGISTDDSGTCSSLARDAMMADGEQIHSAMYPGSIFGDLFSEQTQVNIRQHALESGCFVVCATAWLNPDQQAQIMKDTGCTIGPISGGCFTAIVAPDGSLMGEPIRSGEKVRNGRRQSRDLWRARGRNSRFCALPRWQACRP